MEVIAKEGWGQGDGIRCVMDAIDRPLGKTIYAVPRIKVPRRIESEPAKKKLSHPENSSFNRLKPQCGRQHGFVGKRAQDIHTEAA